MNQDGERFRQALLSRPHLVLLGAGASRAALPDGDRNGRKLPLMKDFVETVGLQRLLADIDVADTGPNFEEIFSALCDAGEPRISEIEKAIEEYFGQLELPDEPTIYDYIVLSLRDHDVIATFNWDPLLVQALRRNKRSIHLIFLHGNVAIGYCATDNVVGLKGRDCSQCREPFEPSKLLYPVTVKDYAAEPQIRAQWEEFRSLLSETLLLTIFGYSAPDSDVEAMNAIGHAWGRPKDRAFEEIEMIDIRSEENVKASWDRLINTHHYAYSENYFDSWLGRQGPQAFEQFIAQTFDAQFIDDHPVPQRLSLAELQDWFRNHRRA